MKEVSRVNMEQLVRYLRGETGSSMPYESLQALDIVLRHKPAMRYSIVGRSLFSPEGMPGSQGGQLGGGAQGWIGYHQSIRPTQSGLVVNVDVSATAYYESGPCIDVLASLIRKHPRDLQRGIEDNDRKKAEKFFAGVRVQVTYRGNMRRKYRVLGLAKTDASRTTFFNGM
jgi:eukaryotic translation initiation factor 2C